MYKVIAPTGVWYIAHKFMVMVLDNGKHCAIPIRPSVFRACMRRCIYPIDKVIEPERKMFWLAFAPALRTMGVIK